MSREGLDGILRDLLSWEEDGRVDVFSVAYHAALTLREQGRYQVAFRLEGLTAAALRGGSQEWTVFAEHLDALRSREAGPALSVLLAELTVLAARTTPPGPPSS